MVYRGILVAGHRGYKEKYPENTIKSYDAAVDAGADVVELDLHISTDKKIFLAHDTNALRVFGKDFELPEQKYDPTIKQLRTLREPHLPVPLFVEMLEWFQKKSEEVANESKRNLQIMLDIKRDNDPKLLIELLLKDLQSVNPDMKWWKEKLVFGIWEPEFYLPELNKYEFDVGIISFDFKKAKYIYDDVVNNRDDRCLVMDSQQASRVPKSC
ncbi:unnamed protein product [Ambrosiozyma monospora]|uniref:Unnamed protein product n=1 Tax=Ambrosiozyma monospora TaxID=43982 RepID=A0ACB5SWD9_AMBMO|nr:unnamed protein product [Ambrosiozyma monospora]